MQKKVVVQGKRTRERKEERGARSKKEEEAAYAMSEPRDAGAFLSLTVMFNLKSMDLGAGKLEKVVRKRGGEEGRGLAASHLYTYLTSVGLLKRPLLCSAAPCGSLYRVCVAFGTHVALGMWFAGSVTR